MAALSAIVQAQAQAPGSGNTGAKTRSMGLDVMRFVAVMLVLYHHANTFPATRKFFLAKIGVLYDALYELRVGAWVGVDLFFVLSGFLISGLIFQELARTGSFSASRFLIRRGFKIYPPFWILLVVTIVVRWWTSQPIPLKALFAELFFLQNYLVGPPPTYVCSFWGLTWTLAVEEHFYFLLAGLVYFLVKRGANPATNGQIIPKLFLWTAIGCFLARLITCAVLPIEPRDRILFSNATHVRMDSLFFGVLLSYYWHNRWDEAFKARLAAKRWLLAAGGVALLLPAIYPAEKWFIVVGFISTYLGAGYLLLAFLALDRRPGNVFTQGMAWLGRHSYPVYLWHLAAGGWILPYIAFKPHSLFASTANLFIYFAASWAVGVGLSLLIERPVLQLRDRLFPWVGSGTSGARAKFTSSDCQTTA